MVGRSQAQPVAEAQAAYAAEIKGVTVGNGAAFSAVAAGGRAARTWKLTSVAYVVSGTPEEEQGSSEVRKRQQVLQKAQQICLFFFFRRLLLLKIELTQLRDKQTNMAAGREKVSHPAQPTCCCSVSPRIRIPQNFENTFYWDATNPSSRGSPFPSSSGPHAVHTHPE